MENKVTRTEFDVFEEYPQLKHTDEREVIIYRLARERTNEFAWKDLITGDVDFDQMLKDDPKLWQKFRTISRRAFDEKDGWAMLIVKTNNELRLLPSRVTALEYSNLTNQINYIQCNFDSISLVNGGATQCNIEFRREGNSITFNFVLDNGMAKVTATEELKQKLVEWFGLSTEFKVIPLVLWKTNPDDVDEFKLEKQMTSRLELVSDIIPDQALNSMAKKESNSSDAESAFLKDKDNKKEFTSTTIPRIGSGDGNYQANYGLYQPEDNLKRFTDFYDWQYDKIKDFSNSIKDDDDDSAQKTRLEAGSINRTATSQLEDNKATFESCIAEVVKIIQVINNKASNEINVNLPFATMGEAIVNEAKNTTKDQPTGEEDE